MTESVVLCVVPWDCSGKTGHFKHVVRLYSVNLEPQSTRAALAWHRLYLRGILCRSAKFSCQQLAVARVLVELVAEKPTLTAIFDINMRRDQHFTTCFFVERVWSSDILYVVCNHTHVCARRPEL